MILSRVKISPQQRYDLEDFFAGQAAARTDSKLWIKSHLSDINLILQGFAVSGIGLNSATVAMSNAALIIPENASDFSFFVSAPAEPNVTITDADLVDSARNYLELELATEDGTPLTKAFWDPEANAGDGAEFNQIVDTVTDLTASFVVSTGGFSGDPNRIPIAIIDVDGSGVIKLILDQRRLFGRLSEPNDPDAEYSWGTKVDPVFSLVMTGVTGTFLADEIITIGGETATVVTGGTTSITFNAPSGNNFSNGDTVTGATSGATGTINTVLESFTGVDKSLTSEKKRFDALATEIKGMKGTRFWWQDAPSTTVNKINIMAALAPLTGGASVVWDGSNLRITDDNLTPASTDQVAAIRVMNDDAELILRRQDDGKEVVTVTLDNIPDAGTLTLDQNGNLVAIDWNDDVSAIQATWDGSGAAAATITGQPSEGVIVIKFNSPGNQVDVITDSNTLTDDGGAVNETIDIKHGMASDDSIAIADGEVLYVSLPKPLADRTYSGVGASATNFKTAARGAVTILDDAFWLAYREGTTLVWRFGGQLDAGESTSVTDVITQAELDQKVARVSSTDDAVVRFDGTSGQVQDSLVKIGDAGEVYGATRLDVDNLRLDGNTVSSTDTNGNVNVTPNGTGRLVSTKETEMQAAISKAIATDAASNGANAVLSTPSTGVVRLTNAGLTSVSEITAPARPQVLVLINHTGAPITINNESGTAANRILTGTGGNVQLLDTASLYLVYDTTETRWMVVGGTGSGSGSGSGGINYVTSDSFDFENSAGAWVTYDDGASATPVDGTGGSPTAITFDRTTTGGEILRETASGKISRSAANGQGEGISYDFTIDPRDQGAELNILFDYKTTANYVSNDVQVYIYDVTNAVMTAVSNDSSGFILAHPSYGNTFRGTYQTSTSSTSYRLILHTTVTTTTAWDLIIDNVTVRPQSEIPVPIVTTPVTFTPTFSAGFGTVTGVSAISWREGKFLKGIIFATTGIVTATTATITVGFNGAVGNVTIASPPAGNFINGSYVTDVTTATSRGVVGINGTSTIALTGGNLTTGLNASQTNNIMSNATSFSLHFQVPIVDWDNGGAISTTEKDLQTITAVYEVSAGTANSSFADNAAEIVDYNVKIVDTHSAVTTGASWKFTAPRAGRYDVSAQLAWTGVTNLASTRLDVYVNNVFRTLLDLQGSATAGFIQGDCTVDLAKGDTIDIRGTQDDTTSAARSLVTTAGFVQVAVRSRADFRAFSTYDTVLPDSRNYAQNAEFRFWQRQDPTVATNRQDAQFSADRWYVLTSGGATNVSGIRVNDSPSTSPTRWCGQFEQEDATPRQYGIAQILSYDRIVELRGKTVTLSFWAYSPSSNVSQLNFSLVSWTGTADSPTKDIVSSWASTPTLIANAAFVASPSTATLGATWTQYSITATIPTNVNNLILFMYTPNTEAANDNFRVTQVQLVKGTRIFPWAQTSLAPTADMLECQAFYEKSWDLDTVPGTASATGALSSYIPSGFLRSAIRYMVSFKVKKRATPTLTTYSSTSGTANTIYESSASTSITTVTNEINTDNAEFSSNAGGNTAAQDWSRYHYTAEAEF